MFTSPTPHTPREASWWTATYLPVGQELEAHVCDPVCIKTPILKQQMTTRKWLHNSGMRKAFLSTSQKVDPTKGKSFCPIKKKMSTTLSPAIYQRNRTDALITQALGDSSPALTFEG